GVEVDVRGDADRVRERVGGTGPELQAQVVSVDTSPRGGERLLRRGCGGGGGCIRSRRGRHCLDWRGGGRGGRGRSGRGGGGRRRSWRRGRGWCGSRSGGLRQ